MMLVTLEQAKKHLSVDFSQDDDYITLLVESASSAVLNYIEDGADVFLDSSGEPDYDSSGYVIGLPYAILAATLILVGYLYRMRDNNDGNEFDRGYLPMPVTALLYPYRKPALA